MGQGGISKALRIASENQGWDPTRIEPTGESIAGFDVEPKIFTNQAGVGRLPQGTPDSFPEDHPAVGGMDSDPPFASPPRPRDEHTDGADPFPGMPGAR